MKKSVIDERLKMKDIKCEVMTYVRKNLPVYKTWSDSNLMDLITFYFNNGQLLISQKENGHIDGILTFQLINDVDKRHSLENEKDSEGVFIDIFIAENQPTREKLVGEAVLGAGIKKWIAFERCKYGQRVSKLPWSLAERIASYGR